MKRSLRKSPTVRKLGRRIQQVRTVQEPDMPWHLHSWRISDDTVWWEQDQKPHWDFIQEPLRQAEERQFYHSAGFVVVQVGEIAKISAPLAGVHKLVAEHPAEIHVVAAASPVPVQPSRASATIIASARLNGPFWAGSGHSMGHSCAGNGKYKCRLSATWVNNIKRPIRTLFSVETRICNLFVGKHLQTKRFKRSQQIPTHSAQKCPNISLVEKDKRASPRLTILPKMAELWVVGQFQRRLRNCHLHSFMAVCSPAAMACKMPGFWRISRRWRRLRRARLGSRTNCTFLELVRRLDEEATLTMPLTWRQQRQQGTSETSSCFCIRLVCSLSNYKFYL